MILAFVPAPTLNEGLKFNRQSTQWDKNSAEYQRKLNSILQFLISSGYPVTMVDDPAFKEMISTLDPKFSLPGMSTCIFHFTKV